MKYITNINTLSVLFDRLIVENIKLYFFTKDNLSENIVHQNQIIHEIKSKISEILIDTYESKQYDYIEEKRTYKYNAIVETVEQLIKSNIITGQSDKENLTEALSENPSIDKFKLNHKILRKSNETRALCKNKIDEQYKEIIENEKND
jgi:hypothetical protein